MNPTCERKSVDLTDQIRPNKQAVVALWSRIHEGLKNAREDYRSHAWPIFTNTHRAKELLGSGLRSTATILIATLALFILVPYLSIRGPANRIAKLVGLPQFWS